MQRLPHRVMLCSILLACIGFDQSQAECPGFKSGVQIGTIETNALVEASGLAASRQNAGVFWSHNDSGDSARLFAFNSGGEHLGIYNLSGVTAIDFEDIAVGPGPIAGIDYLYVGDIGDNPNIRPNVKVYRVAEPVVDARQSPVTVTLSGVEMITLTYPQGPRDAETVMVDTNADLYIVSKRVTALGRVYRAAFPQLTGTTPALMQFVAELPWGAISGNGGATGGDIASDGSAIVVRRLTTYDPPATLWLRPPGTNLWDAFDQPGCDLTLISEPLGEGICFHPDSLSYYTLSEGSNQPLYFFEHELAPGDTNGDDQINVDDLLAVINAWGPCPPPCPADLDDDGDVDVDDLLVVINNWSL